MGLLRIIEAFLRPVTYILISASFLPAAVLSSAAALDPSISSLRQRWFAHFWTFFGPQSAEAAGPEVCRLLTRARGTVLDVGPGQGHFLRHYDGALISRLVLVEPNANHHDALRRAAAEAGLLDKVEIVGLPVQELLVPGHRADGLGPGSVDTVVTLQVLCSVPQPRDVVRDLYKLLKPGGEWLLHEHVTAAGRQKLYTNLYQWILSPIWPYFLGGCELRRDTLAAIRAAGPWRIESVRNVDDDIHVIPHIAGFLVKE